jgi:hypothetical protein
MSISQVYDIGEWVAFYQIEGSTATITATNDGSTNTTSYLDRLGSTGNWTNNYQSCMIVIPFSATLAAGETVSVLAHLEDATSSTGANAADHGSTATTTIFGSTASTAAQQIDDAYVLDVNLREAQEFIRVAYVFTVSATASDQVDSYQVGLVLSGGDLPAT